MKWQRELLAGVRARHGLTQTDLARLLEVDWSTISRWERQQNPAPRFLARAVRDLERELALAEDTDDATH
jgi:DNA-binding XRE family transcriptional regulator